MAEFIEEAFDEVAEAIEVDAEGGDVHPVGHRLDVAPCLSCETRPEGVAIVAAVGLVNPSTKLAPSQSK
jgi:hypothetical protein